MAKPRKRIKGHTKSCASKQAFETIEKATAAAKRGRWDFMHAYQCRRCKKFHYGHPSKVLLPKFSG